MNTSVIDLTVKKRRKETDEYLSVIFEKPEGFVFESGDCFDIRFVHDTYGKVFSFSSSPTEKDLMITFRKGMSDFKRRLENISPDDVLQIKQYGNQFGFHPEKPSIFFAGGIGIASFRSMIKNAIDMKQKSQITLVYLNRNEQFPFKKELDKWQKVLSYKIFYLVTQSVGRLNAEKLQELIPDIVAKRYESYIAGPPGMVDATFELLQDIGVETKRIHTDSFDGYFEEL